MGAPGHHIIVRGVSIPAPEVQPAPDIDFLPVPDIAEALGVIVTKVHQMLRDRTIVGCRVKGVLMVPAAFIADGEVVHGLPGTITLLADAGYDDGEIIDWLFTAEPSADSEPVTAIAQLRAGHVRQVHRQAQVAGF